MGPKMKFIVPLLALLVAGAGYKFVLAAPAPVAHEPKVEGQVMVLPKDFLINLRAGGFAKLTVGMVVGHMPPEEGAEEEASEPPEGFAGLPQEAVVRSVITDVLTNSRRAEYTARRGRERLKQRVRRALLKQTDLPVKDVLLSDVTVQ